jgi:hypothetical protein
LARFLQGLIAALAVLALAAVAQSPPASTAPPLKFSHAQHAQLGDVGPLLKAARKAGTHLWSGAGHPESPEPRSGCQACHGGMATGQPKGRLAMMADCLVCHTKIDPPFSCSFCHTGPEAAWKPISHSADFLDKHTAGLAKLNLAKAECAVCHGRKFTCLGCH